MNEHTRRDGAETVDPPALTPTLLSRSTTDRLLDHRAGPEPLRQILAAAAAPTQAHELRGEQAARQAFTTSARFRPHPDLAARHCPRRTRALSWIVAAKAITALALTAGAGGVALAATSHSFPHGQPDVSTQQESDPGPSGTRPTIIVDRARDTAQHPGTQPAPEPPGPPDSTRHDRTGSGASHTSTAPPPGEDTQPTPPTVAPANPQHPTGPGNGNRGSTATTPPGQQQQQDKQQQQQDKQQEQDKEQEQEKEEKEKEKEKENSGNTEAGAEKEHPENSAGQE